MLYCTKQRNPTTEAFCKNFTTSSLRRREPITFSPNNFERCTWHLFLPLFTYERQTKVFHSFYLRNEVLFDDKVKAYLDTNNVPYEGKIIDRLILPVLHISECHQELASTGKQKVVPMRVQLYYIANNVGLGKNSRYKRIKQMMDECTRATGEECICFSMFVDRDFRPNPVDKNVTYVPSLNKLDNPRTKYWLDKFLDTPEFKEMVYHQSIQMYVKPDTYIRQCTKYGSKRKDVL